MNTTELSQALETMDPVELALGAGLAGVFGTIMVIGSIIWFFVSAIGFFKMFKKANQPGWTAFIPLFSSYICFKISWNIKSFWIYIIAIFGMQLTQIITDNIIVSLISLVAAIVALVFHFKLNFRLAKSFRKSTGWGILLSLFPFIASLILGFGDAQYVGNLSNNQKA